MDLPWLTETEIRSLTNKVQIPAQLRVIKKLGYSVRPRPDGSFIVPRDQFYTASKPQDKDYKMDFSALGHGKTA